MLRVSNRVFISYRDTNTRTAVAIFQRLFKAGYDCFLGHGGMHNDLLHEEIIKHQIRSRSHFLLIVSYSAMRDLETSFLRQEIEFALNEHRNVILMMFEDFDTLTYDGLPETLQDLFNLPTLKIQADNLNASVQNLTSRFLSMPVDIQLHPIPTQYTQEIQKILNNMLAQPIIPDDIVIVDAYFERGDYLFQNKEYEQALVLMKDAVRIVPNDHNLLYARALTYTKLGDHERALDDLTRVIDIFPNHVHAYLIRGQIYRMLNKDNLALADFDKLAEMNVALPQVYTERALIYAGQKKYNLALENTNRLVELNPNHIPFHYVRAEVNLSLGRFKDSLADCDEILRLDPENSNAYYMRGKVYEALNELDNAIAAYDKSASLIANNEGKLLLRRERLDDNSVADVYFELKNDHQHIAYGVELMRTKRLAEAIGHFNEAIRQNPQNFDGYALRSSAYENLKKLNEAIEDALKAFEIKPSPKTSFRIGDLYRRTNDFEDAIAQFTDTLSLDEKFIPAYMNRGGTYLAMGDHSRALSDFDAVLAIESQNPTAHHSRGLVLEYLGRFEEAKKAFSSAIMYGLKQPEDAFVARARVYSKQKMHQEAIADCEKALKLNAYNQGARHLLDASHRAREKNEKMFRLFVRFGLVFLVILVKLNT